MRAGPKGILETCQQGVKRKFITSYLYLQANEQLRSHLDFRLVTSVLFGIAETAIWPVCNFEDSDGFV